MSGRLPTAPGPGRDQQKSARSKPILKEVKGRKLPRQRHHLRQRGKEKPRFQYRSRMKKDVSSYIEKGNAGSLTQVGERSTATVRDPSRDGTFSFNLLEHIYAEGGQKGYERDSLSAVMKALEKF